MEVAQLPRIDAEDEAESSQSSAREPAVNAITGRLTADLEALERERDEIALLVGQAREETDRHESRRVKADERVKTLEKDPRPNPDELKEARTQLLALTRRQMLFDAQREVLEGKQKALTRHRDAVAGIVRELGGMDPSLLPSAQFPTSTRTEPGMGAGTSGGGAIREKAGPDSVAVLRAQEDLRRDIARQMHDGPAQSLANIALQAEIVERLVARGDVRAAAELGALRRMVHSTLAATKEFIFDVRPMVLDDLGIVPTLRRTATDRGQRSGIEVDFDSSGADKRLSPDLETGLFRIVDDLIGGYLAARPSRVTVRLDWSPTELLATVRGQWATTAPARARRDEPPAKDLPPALAAMIEQNDTAERQALIDARSVSSERLAEIRSRAQILGVSLTSLDDGQATEIAATFA